MKLSNNWLNEWVKTDADTQLLMDQLTMLGLEVDGVEPAAGEFTGVVVAEIMSCEKHPDADKLKVCQVNSGSETLQIVCGAPNARTGLKTALSTIGAVLPGNFKIKKSKLRGVESNGMLCSGVELGISDESDGIIELPADAPVGTDVRDYLQLNDQIIDIDLTPNRADCFCIRGVAREVATLNDLTVIEPNIQSTAAQIDDTVSVRIEAEAECPRYGSRVIKGINNNVETPLWMQEKLRRAGVRSIHPVVDVTNYVMMELGQPMHAFDLHAIDSEIIVRMARAEEKVQLLDESEAELDDSFLVIADQSKVLAVAGVMGGLSSGVVSKTNDIVLESAYFDPATIMGKSRTLGVHTESGLRFERGVDHALQTLALERATALIVEICGGEVGPVQVVESESTVPAQNTIALSENKLQRVLGFEVPTDQVTKIFEKLGFAPTFEQGNWQVTAPTWRFDLGIAEDLVEEVVRVVGYDQMPSHRLQSTDAIRVIPEALRQVATVKARISDLGYQEVINYSFVANKALQQLGMDAEGIALANPLTNEMAVMRTHLLSGVLGNIKANVSRKENDLALFELGKVFQQQDQIVQTDMLIMAKTGLNQPEQWVGGHKKVDFFDLKGDVEQLLASAPEVLSWQASTHEYLHPGRQANVVFAGDVIGVAGQVHPRICQKMKIKQDVYVAQLDAAAVSQISIPAWHNVSKFPKVRRDLSILIKEQVSWTDVKTCVQNSMGNARNVLQAVSLFDVYQGENIEKGSKSLAMALIFQEKNRTLEDKEVDKLVSKAVSSLAEEFNAEIRS